MIGWIVVGLLVAGFAVGAFLWIRSEKRWQPPPAATPEGKEAEARLRSTGTAPSF